MNTMPTKTAPVERPLTKIEPKIDPNRRLNPDRLCDPQKRGLPI